MAHPAVYFLAPVDVCIQQQNPRAETSRALARLVDQGEEAPPVEQSGEFIFERHAPQRVLSLLTDRHVACDRQAKGAAANLDQPSAELAGQSMPCARHKRGLIDEAPRLAQGL